AEARARPRQGGQVHPPGSPHGPEPRRGGVGADYEAQRDRGTETEPESAGLRETARGSGGRAEVGVVPLVSAAAASGLRSAIGRRERVTEATQNAHDAASKPSAKTDAPIGSFAESGLVV